MKIIMVTHHCALLGSLLGSDIDAAAVPGLFILQRKVRGTRPIPPCHVSITEERACMEVRLDLSFVSGRTRTELCSRSGDLKRASFAALLRGKEVSTRKF